ncbi:uncharacterized protein LAJ45_07261 [Morchella importuna]|uniref:YDG domain-containing protein n=1 Tax=Morchella conica CCBAS932 TaxID=1392247 RepID=A0A3N4KWZ1_9PEZI|nr:uncharacterized protein LAJ45_07261 [Morchella importuna]KAH8148550.1 hypothetical protein LAJ45_07261 [Morchella importuna]RPB15074.1 hypothetical protein P167DRAFT_543390 [Morchella conica CCBAS932]
MSLESYSERLKDALTDSNQVTLSRILSAITWLKAENNEISAELVQQYDLPNIVSQISENESLPEPLRLQADRLLSRWSRGIFDAPHTPASHRRTGPGDLGLVVGDVWPDRESMHREGVHASLQAGICGDHNYGAYSIVANGVYRDEDKGDEIWYCGTDAKGDRRPTSYTKYLMRSVALGNPLRVFRGKDCPGTFAPQKGFRYDGMYLAVDKRQPPRNFTKPAKGEGNFEFLLRRVEGQAAIQKGMPDSTTLAHWHAQKLEAARVGK